MSRIEAALEKARALARTERARLSDLRPPQQPALPEREMGSLGLAELSREELVAREGPQPLSRRQLDQGRLIDPRTSGDPVADMFSELRARVLRTKLGANSIIQTIPVDRGAGGTFVATNLAMSLSFDERASVMLVDCSFRDPSCHRLLSVDVKFGLTDFIDMPDLPPSEIVYQTPFPGLLLVPAGSNRNAGSAYFLSSRLRRLFSAFKAYPGERDIVVDGPAATQAADASSLAELADFVLLVVAYGKSTRSAIATAANVADPNKLLGVVCNNEPSVRALLRGTELPESGRV